MPRPPAPGRLIARLLADAQAPVFALDAQRQIVFANRALAAWLGLEADQLIGQRCDYAAAADDPIRAACAALCPPPETFTGQIADGFASRLATADLPFERRRVQFVHLPGADAVDALLLVVV